MSPLVSKLSQEFSELLFCSSVIVARSVRINNEMDTEIRFLLMQFNTGRALSRHYYLNYVLNEFKYSGSARSVTNIMGMTFILLNLKYLFKARMSEYKIIRT
jgi:hypothetical protein